MSTLSDQVRSSYYDLARQGQLFTAYATVTASVIYTTATGTGGPLLWNNTSGARQAVNAVLLGVGVGVTTAATAASALGITGGSGQSSAPSSNTAIDGSGNCLMGGPAPLCNVYRKGTVTTAGAFFIPTHSLGTGALTTFSAAANWVDLGGSIVVPPGSWASVAAAATATSCVASIVLLWAEIPL